MVLAGILALVYPVLSSFAVVFAFGCLLIISGIAQGMRIVMVRRLAKESPALSPAGCVVRRW